MVDSLLVPVIPRAKPSGVPNAVWQSRGGRTKLNATYPKRLQRCHRPKLIRTLHQASGRPKQLGLPYLTSFNHLSNSREWPRQS